MCQPLATATASTVILLAIALVLAGCGGDSGPSTVHQVPKGSEPINHDQSPANAPASPAPMVDHPPWSLPQEWQPVAGSRPMRHSTFFVEIAETPVEIAIAHFPGEVGGVVANLNRWRSQIGLGPIAAADVEALIEHFATSPGFSGYTAHLQGDTMHMLVGSIHEEAADRTWFVRATLPPELAPQLRPALFAFARSFGGGGN
jgi:hypothetical protein